MLSETAPPQPAPATTDWLQLDRCRPGRQPARQHPPLPQGAHVGGVSGQKRRCGRGSTPLLLRMVLRVQWHLPARVSVSARGTGWSMRRATGCPVGRPLPSRGIARGRRDHSHSTSSTASGSVVLAGVPTLQLPGANVLTGNPSRAGEPVRTGDETGIQTGSHSPRSAADSGGRPRSQNAVTCGYGLQRTARSADLFPDTEGSRSGPIPTQGHRGLPLARRAHPDPVGALPRRGRSGAGVDAGGGGGPGQPGPPSGPKIRAGYTRLI